MDRLTRRMCGGWGLVEGCELNTPAGMRRVVERLAAYENAGIEPELAAMYAKYHNNRGSIIPDLDELAAFRAAQAEGRIAVIPKAAKSFRPMVTADPQDNVSTALNLFYVNDRWTWVRGGGPAPDYADISLCDYVRQIAKAHNLDMAQGDDEEMSMEMSELLFDGIGTVEGIVATLYTVAWAFAELRERLKEYEATGKTPNELLRQMTTPFENDPFPIVYRAFKNLFPDKSCTIFYGVKDEDEHGEEGHGYTFFPDDGSDPEVTVFSDNDTNVQAEILAHELAHVAVGQEHDHDQVWEDAFDAIHTEFCRLSDELFAWMTEGGDVTESDGRDDG